MKNSNETENLVTKAEVVTPLPPVEPLPEVIITEPVEVNHDTAVIAKAKKIISEAITGFIDVSTIVLNDPNYLSDIFWEYPLSKNTKVENLRISFRQPYGYFSEYLITERVGNNQPIRKKVYLQIDQTASNTYLQDKLDVLFQTQARIMNDLNLYKTEVDKEIEGIQSSSTGEELSIQFMNLIDGVISRLREIDLTDTFTYQNWVYKL